MEVYHIRDDHIVQKSSWGLTFHRP